MDSEVVDGKAEDVVEHVLGPAHRLATASPFSSREYRCILRELLSWCVLRLFFSFFILTLVRWLALRVPAPALKRLSSNITVSRLVSFSINHNCICNRTCFTNARSSHPCRRSAGWSAHAVRLRLQLDREVKDEKCAAAFRLHETYMFRNCPAHPTVHSS